MSGNDALLATSDVTPIEEEVDAPFDAKTLDAVDLLVPAVPPPGRVSRNSSIEPIVSGNSDFRMAASSPPFLSNGLEGAASSEFDAVELVSGGDALPIGGMGGAGVSAVIGGDDGGRRGSQLAVVLDPSEHALDVAAAEEEALVEEIQHERDTVRFVCVCVSFPLPGAIAFVASLSLCSLLL